MSAATAWSALADQDQTQDTSVAGGWRVRLRPLRPGDRTRLAAGYRGLSEHTAYRRFFTVFPELSASQLRFLTDIDHHGHEAIGAEDPSTGQGLGVARYVRSATDPTEAEVAVTVADDWQHTGVGTALLAALAERASAEHIATFTAEVLTENPAMRALLGKLGPVELEHTDDPTTLTASGGADLASAAGLTPGARGGTCRPVLATPGSESDHAPVINGNHRAAISGSRSPACPTSRRRMRAGRSGPRAAGRGRRGHRHRVEPGARVRGDLLSTDVAALQAAVDETVALAEQRSRRARRALPAVRVLVGWLFAGSSGGRLRGRSR